MLLRILFVLSFIFCTFSPARADEPPHHATARLVSSVQGVGQLKTIQLGINIHLEQGWDTYWRTPGEAGLAPVFDWAGSTNLKEAKVEWPAPARFTSSGIDNFVYTDEVTFPVDVTLAKPGKPLSVNLKLDLLVCGKLCLPETERLTLDIPAGEAQVSPDQVILAAASKHLPNHEDAGLTIRKTWLAEGADKGVYLHVDALSDIDPGADADLFVETSPFVSFGKPLVAYDPPTKQLHFQAAVRSADTLETLKKKLGSHETVLTITAKDQSFERRVRIDNEMLPNAATKALVKEVQDHFRLNILLLAFLGGLILNLMPCVLPVLSLKILSVLSHGGKDHHIHRWTIFRNFMASAAGILFSFWVMATALAMLKSAGQSIGWGIQFQQPAFLIFLIVILAVFAANMWGLFEIPLPRFIAHNLPAQHEHEPTLLGHFLTGAFATLLATPCTAPFLGSAVGFALAGEISDIFIVFTFLGLGLAFPYILLALSPRIFKYMPKPGTWMIVMKKILAAALALTAAWLLSVLITVSTQPALDDGWTTFDEALIKPAVDEGKTVIVDVTADWCLTCKANKRLVLDQPDVEDALFAPNMLRLQADWTQRDETIAAYLRKYGRYGVPFNIVYGPGAPNGIILSELLSKKEVMRALSEAASE